MIEMLRCSPLTSVQDLGRQGFRHIGVSLAGALDPIAARQVNILVGNDINEAVIEITIGPVEIQVQKACLVAISGTEFIATITAVNSNQDTPNIRPMRPGFATFVEAGEQIRLKHSRVAGGRCYIAFAGGLDVPLVLGSRSTDINAGFGGLMGRTLRSGDKIALGSPSSISQRLLKALPNEKHILNRGIRPLVSSYNLRALAGVDASKLPASTIAKFWQQDWRVSPQSNRMGIRLHGLTPLSEPIPSLLSSGVLPGDVQLPGDGQPIILANDAQTIGGYPRVAHVINADLWKLAHLAPNSPITFTEVSIEKAIQIQQALDHYWHRLAHWRDLAYAPHTSNKTRN